MRNRTETEKGHNNVIALCPKCGRFPFMTIFLTDPFQIKLRCSCKNQTTIIHLNKYLSTLQSTSHLSNVKEESICKKHIDHSNSYYCTNCLIHFCELCKGEHNQHDCYNLFEIKKKIDIDAIREKLNTAKEFGQKLKVEILDDLIESLMERIRQLNQSYQDCVERNSQVLQMIEILFNNYAYTKNGLNYPNMINLLSHVDFDMNYEVVNDVDDEIIVTINYFDSFKIIKPKPKPTTNVSILEGHTKEVNSMILFSSNQIATCGNDKSIKIFNLDTKKVDVNIPNAHSKAVTYIAKYSNNQIISCSSDCMIKIWTIDKNKYNCDDIVGKQTIAINQVLPIYDGQIASLSGNGDIFIWKKIKKWKCIHSLQKNKILFIISIQNGENLIFTDSSELFIFYSDTFKEEKIIPKSKNLRIWKIHEMNGKLIILNLKPQKFIIFDLTRKQIETQIFIDVINFTYFWKCPSFFLEYDNNTILYLLSRKAYIMIDMTTFQFRDVNYGNSNEVDGNIRAFLQINDNLCASSNIYSHSIIVWNKNELLKN